MTDTEKLLFIEAIVWKKAYEDSNPNVGMGPSMKTIAQEISEITGVIPDADELSFILVTAEIRS